MASVAGEVVAVDVEHVVFCVVGYVLADGVDVVLGLGHESAVAGDTDCVFGCAQAVFCVFRIS